MESLPELLSATARNFPNKGIGFVNPDRSVSFITFPELELKALSMLAGMQDKGLRKGDVVILSLEKSEEIIPVLWGCFVGGIVPALLQPVDPAPRKADGMVCKTKGELRAYVHVDDGPAGVWILPLVPPDSDCAPEQLNNLIY